MTDLAGRMQRMDNEQLRAVNAAGNAMVLAAYHAKQAENSGPVEQLTRGARLRELEANRSYSLQQGDLNQAEYWDLQIDQLCESARDARNQRARDEQRPRDENGRFVTGASGFDGGARPTGRRWSPFDRHSAQEATGTELMRSAMRRSVAENHERNEAGADGSIDLFGDVQHQPPSYR
jgi:hypothetical protein